MRHYISVSKCETFYHTYFNCSFSGPPDAQTLSTNISLVGGVEKGQFEGNPDVAGIGILFAFMGVTILAALSSMVAVIIKTFHSCRMSSKTSRMALGNVHALVCSCSDQQILTGLAYTICLGFRIGCELSAYHLVIVQDTLCLIGITQTVSAYCTYGLDQSLWLPALRSICIIAFWTLGCAFMILPTNWGPVPFPNEESNAAYFLPAVCFMPESESAPSANDGPINKGADIAMLSYMSSTTLFLLCLSVWGTGHLIFWAQYILKRTSKLRNTKVRTVLWRTHNILCPLVAVIAPFCLWNVAAEVVMLRQWVHRSGWMNVEHGNPEQELSDIGQLVPAMLFPLALRPMGDLTRGFTSREYNAREA